MFDSNTRTIVVVGAQWGDEGKGKLVDVLAERADWVVRYQGGANAGHTVHIGDKSFVLHQIPSGILHPGVRCAIGNGVVLDVETLFAEIDELVSDGIDVEGRLYVSDRAHLVLPYHKLVDGQSSASKEIGTTGRGIGPAYEDKYGRRGIRVLDLRDPERLRKLVERGVAHANIQLATSGAKRAGRRLHARRARSIHEAAAAARRGRRAQDSPGDIGRRGCAARGRAGIAARHRSRHVPVRHLEQHDVRRCGDWRRHRAEGARLRDRRGEGVHDARRATARCPPSSTSLLRPKYASWGTSLAPRRGVHAAAAGSTESSSGTPRASMG